MTSNSTSVLAIGIDAAESTLVRQLIEHDEMPALKSLLEDGKWLSVRSPSPIGSGTVWPTFITGEEPTLHGNYSEWKWLPETMSLRRYHGLHLIPFWKKLAEQGLRVGVFDVPFAPPVGIAHGFEVFEWWAHDSTADSIHIFPDRIRSLVLEAPAHPLSANRFNASTPDSKSDLKDLAAACSEGARLRGMLAQHLIKKTKPQLSLIVFPEMHHAGHQLWHTVAPDHPVYRDLHHDGTTEPLLKDVYRAVDQQIGELIDSTSDATAVMVFALHGMRPARGFPGFLDSLLCEQGFAQLATWRSQTWSKRVVSSFAAIKRTTPTPLKKFYYQVMPTTATYKLARPTMLPAYDWRKTRAFSLPTDQYGWIRINLSGRESEGIVQLDEYENVCNELEKMLSGLTSEDGELLVQDVQRTAINRVGAIENPLPDLVVHWRDAALGLSLKIKGSRVRTETVSTKATGQHASEGFCIYRGEAASGLEDTIAAKDLGRLMTTC